MGSGGQLCQERPKSSNALPDAFYLLSKQKKRADLLFKALPLSSFHFLPFPATSTEVPFLNSPETTDDGSLGNLRFEINFYFLRLLLFSKFNHFYRSKSVTIVSCPDGQMNKRTGTKHLIVLDLPLC